MARRDNPYGAFNFLVSLGGDQGDGAQGTIVGGFSDVSGLGEEVHYSEYRNGNEKYNTVRKVSGSHKIDDVTLKRGLIGSLDMYQWLKAYMDGAKDVRQVNITVLDEARNPVMVYKLRNAQPKKYTGPTFAAKGGGEVAMEELQLVCEGIDVRSP